MVVASKLNPQQKSISNQSQSNKSHFIDLQQFYNSKFEYADDLTYFVTIKSILWKR